MSFIKLWFNSLSLILFYALFFYLREIETLKNEKNELISANKDFNTQNYEINKNTKTPKYHPYQHPIIIKNITPHHSCHYKSPIEVS